MSKESNQLKSLISSGAENENGATGASSTDLPVPLLDLIPSAVFLRLVALSDYSTRLALCLTCKRGRDEVEIHEKRVYEAIKREHRVDRTYL